MHLGDVTYQHAGDNSVTVRGSSFGNAVLALRAAPATSLNYSLYLIWPISAPAVLTVWLPCRHTRLQVQASTTTVMQLPDALTLGHMYQISQSCTNRLSNQHMSASGVSCGMSDLCEQFRSGCMRPIHCLVMCEQLRSGCMRPIHFSCAPHVDGPSYFGDI